MATNSMAEEINLESKVSEILQASGSAGIGVEFIGVELAHQHIDYTHEELAEALTNVIRQERAKLGFRFNSLVFVRAV